MEFRTIDPILDREMIIAFRKDSYVASGHSLGFGDEDDMLLVSANVFFVSQKGK